MVRLSCIFKLMNSVDNFVRSLLEVLGKYGDSTDHLQHIGPH
jgi:hypothetical protein